MKDRWLVTAFRPGDKRARATMPSKSVRPAATTTCSGATWCTPASFSRSSLASLPGYRLDWVRTARMASMAKGDGPKGLSLEASLMYFTRSKSYTAEIAENAKENQRVLNVSHAAVLCVLCGVSGRALRLEAFALPPRSTARLLVVQAAGTRPPAPPIRADASALA